MRLGARWNVGDAPHGSVPDVLHAAIAEQEAAHTGARAWTLTWLEGRARCELDDIVRVAQGGDGGVAVTPLSGADDADDDDDWLGA